MSLIFSKLFPFHLDESGFVVDDLSLLILIKMLWAIDCGRNKTINLLIITSTFSLECFSDDYKDRNKRVNSFDPATVILPAK